MSHQHFNKLFKQFLQQEERKFNLLLLKKFLIKTIKGLINLTLAAARETGMQNSI